jgi:hypothetical protein
MLGKATADAIFWSGSKVADIGEALSDLLSKIVSATTSALNPFNQDPYRDLDLSFFDPVPGHDDIDGVAIEFVNYGVFETVAPATVTVQTLFYSSGGGPRLVNDEPIAGLVAAPRGSEPEVLIVDQPIG